MRLGRRLGMSLRALLAHRLRAALALSSVAMGVAGVLLTSAIGQGAQDQVLGSIEAIGTDLLVVRPAAAKRSAARKAVQGLVTSLEVEDSEAIAALASVRKAVPGTDRPMRVKAGNGAVLTSVLGTTSDFPDVRRFRLRGGRFFDDLDDRGQRVAVLGDRVRERLFPDEDPIGRWIRIRDIPFEVIGVLEPKGVLADGSDEDNQVVVPIRTALRRVFNSTWITSVFVSVRDPRAMKQAETEISAVLRERHRRGKEAKPDDFAVQNKTKFLASQQELAEFLTLLTSGLAGLALIVGGTGILALMLLSVKERTPEIGLRMAVGATPRDILLQFLAEATALALGGWAAGAVAGALGAAAVAFGTEWKVGLPFRAILASLSMAGAIGLGFGAFPARKASRMSPIQALAAE